MDLPNRSRGRRRSSSLSQLSQQNPTNRRREPEIDNLNQLVQQNHKSKKILIGCWKWPFTTVWRDLVQSTYDEDEEEEAQLKINLIDQNANLVWFFFK